MQCFDLFLFSNDFDLSIYDKLDLCAVRCIGICFRLGMNCHTLLCLLVLLRVFEFFHTFFSCSIHANSMLYVNYLLYPSVVCYFQDSLRAYGRKKGWCPYFLARHSVSHKILICFLFLFVLIHFFPCDIYPVMYSFV